MTAHWLSDFLSSVPRFRAIALLVVVCVLQVAIPAALAAPTTTALAVTSGGKAAAIVMQGSAVTLTATVNSGRASVTQGTVNFCEATAISCTDINRLRSVQLNGTGTAVFRFVPGIGSHSYRAVFQPTAQYGASSSAVQMLSVTGPFRTLTTVQITGPPSSAEYNLSATVYGTGSSAPTGNVSLLDISDANTVLGTAPLSANDPHFTSLRGGSYTAGASPTDIVAADFNGDGFADLAVLNSASPNGPASISILLGTGNGAFTTAASSSAPDNPTAVVVGDFNGDGKPDLAVASGSGNTVSVLLGKGDGTFTQVQASASTGINPVSLVTADFDGDGILDLATADQASNTITVLLGHGDGTFSPVSAAQQTGDAPSLIATADFNSDGIPDLAALNSGILSIFLGNGDGTFNLVSSGGGTGTETDGLAIADFNGDGIPDLAAATTSIGGTSNNPIATVTLTTLQGNGDGTFQTGESLTFTDAGTGPALAILAGDFDGDGVVDLAVESESSEEPFYKFLDILLGDGTGGFRTTGAESANFFSFSGPLVTEDFDGDGLYDIAAVDQQFADPYTPASVVLLISSAGRTATATFNSIALPVATGSGQVSAVYSGDANNQTSTSAPVTLQSGMGTATASVLATPNPAFFGQSITLTAAISGAGLMPTGQVTFYDGSGQLGTSALNNGVAVYNSSTFPAGSHSITASYPGDANYNQVTSPALLLTVQKAAPKLTLTPSSSSISVTQMLSLAIDVAGAEGNSVPQGSVLVMVGSYSSAATALLNGSASLTVPAGSLPTGSNTITAVFTPSATSAGSYTSATQSAVVTVTGSDIAALTATPSAPSITDQQSVVVTVTVTGGGEATPTGVVTLGNGPFMAQTTLLSATASFTVPAGTLIEGTNTLSLAYAGDANYAGSSTTATVTVSPVVIAVPAIPPIAEGGSTTLTVGIATGSTYSGTLDLTCKLISSPQNALDLPVCSFNPATFVVSGGANKSSVLTLSTTASSAEFAAPKKDHLMHVGEGGLALAGILMIGSSVRRRRWASLAMLSAIFAITGVAGCSGGSTTPSTPSNPGTTAGTYTFAVTATDSVNATTQSSTTVSVTVQ